MPKLTLVIGNKNYSSWSFRAWLALSEAGIPFEEVFIPLDQPDTAAKIAPWSPSGRVPALKEGDVVIWESLAILEYAAEKAPSLWPSDPAARALARSVSAEMHAGFTALRNHCPMKFKDRFPAQPLPADVAKDVERIVSLWDQCRARFGQGGALLFGAFTAADAMFAPVVSRFLTYAVPVPDSARKYMEAVQKLRGWQAWEQAAAAEQWKMARYET